MDKLYRAIAVLFILAVSSCTGYDDSDIRGGLSDLENRVSRLETLCSQMNSNINALQTIVNALQQKEFIESVTPLADGQGYTLTFSSGKTVTIYNGKDGKNGAAGTDGKDGVDGKDGKDGVDGRDGSTPLIGIKQHTDGVWYWTVNGDWLHDSDGNMVKAVGTDGQDGNNGNDGADGKDGKDGVTPKLKIEDGMWYVSCDGGVSWELLGRATGEDGASAGIISVTEEDGYVRFGMQDGTVISIAKRQPLGISFSTDDVAITVGGGSKIIGYTLVGASENVVVKALVQDGWKAKINKESPSEGTIEITAPSPLVESEILIFVSDGGQTALAAVNCVKSTVIISQEQYNVSESGGNLEVSGMTNTDFMVSIPGNAKSWLSLVQTKSMNPMSFTLSVEANGTPFERDAVISVLDDAGATIRTLSVRQSGDLSKLVSVQVDTKGELRTVLEAYDKSRIVNLKISGVLNDVDFLDIYYEMPSLRYLDISDVEIETLPKDCFKKSTNVTTIILPKTLTSIPADCFRESKISGSLTIPAICKTIGGAAFGACSSLKSVKISASCEKIGIQVFSGCKALETVEFAPGSSLTAIPHYAFDGCVSLASIKLPASCEEVGGSAFKNCTALETAEFEYGSSLKEIKTGAFDGCVSLTSIKIPSTCETIGSHAFAGCSALTSVDFGSNSSLKKIGGGYMNEYSFGAFNGCSSLISIKIPSSCETIEPAAFKDCRALKTVEFESGCALKTIAGGYYSHYNSSYHYGVFSGCKSLIQIVIPAACETIEPSAFYGCFSLASVVFSPDSMLKTICGGIDDYSGCYGAFSYCGLESIMIPSSCENIEPAAFKGCRYLADLAFDSESVLSYIGDEAFNGCWLMHRISMSNCAMLREIGADAFSGSDQIYFFQIGASNPPQLGNRVFGSVGVYSVLKVPAGSESAYKSASGWNAFSSITAID